MRLCVIVILVCAATAHAEPTPGPAWCAGVAITGGTGGSLESLSFHRRVELGGFLRFDNWTVTLSMPWAELTSTDVERDSAHVGDFALGGRLAYHRPFYGTAVAMVALGLERHWLYGHQDVVRVCQFTHNCIAGFYTETPSYQAWVPQLRVGIGVEQVTLNGVLGLTFDVIVEPYDLTNVPPDGLRGVVVLAGITGTVGEGPLRRLAPSPSPPKPRTATTR